MWKYWKVYKGAKREIVMKIKKVKRTARCTAKTWETACNELHVRPDLSKVKRTLARKRNQAGEVVQLLERLRVQMDMRL